MSKVRININAEGRIKLFFSIALFVLSIIASFIGTNAFVFLPMFASMIGDISIMTSRGCITGKRENTFNYGIIAFAVAHILYIGIMPTKYQSIILSICIVLFIIVVYTSLKFKKEIPSFFYAVIIILNFINSIFYDPISMYGMIVFIISDLILAYGEDKSPWYQIPIWIFYISGQVLLITKFLLR